MANIFEPHPVKKQFPGADRLARIRTDDGGRLDFAAWPTTTDRTTLVTPRFIIFAGSSDPVPNRTESFFFVLEREIDS
ncbi:hypothetical protein U1Q18_033212 [Sarracenia purpurea var. burkii]